MTYPRLPSTVTSSRHPASWGAFVAALLAGCWGLFVPGGQSNAVDNVLPDWFSTFYYAGFAVFGLLGIISLSLSDPDDRIRAERCAWYGVGWLSLFYTLAAFTSVGPSAGQAAILVGAYSPVATYRIIQISRQRRQVLRDAEQGLPASPPPLGVADPGGDSG